MGGLGHGQRCADSASSTRMQGLWLALLCAPFTCAETGRRCCRSQSTGGMCTCVRNAFSVCVRAAPRDAASCHGICCRKLRS